MIVFILIYVDKKTLQNSVADEADLAENMLDDVEKPNLQKFIFPAPLDIQKKRFMVL